MNLGFQLNYLEYFKQKMLLSATINLLHISSSVPKNWQEHNSIVYVFNYDKFIWIQFVVFSLSELKDVRAIKDNFNF